MSKVTRIELAALIREAKVTGDWSAVEQADVSGIKNFDGLFAECDGIGDLDLSRWDVSNGKVFSYMFAYSDFNGDVSQWDVSNGENFHGMFARSPFNGDISQWTIQEGADTKDMFFECPLQS